MNLTTSSGTGTTNYSPYDYTNTNTNTTTDYNAILNEMETYTSTNELMNSVSGNNAINTNSTFSY